VFVDCNPFVCTLHHSHYELTIIVFIMFFKWAWQPPSLMVSLVLSWFFECLLWLSWLSYVLLSFMGFWYVRREQHKIIRLFNQVLVHQCHGFLVWWTCLPLSPSSNMLVLLFVIHVHLGLGHHCGLAPLCGVLVCREGAIRSKKLL